MLQNVTGQEVDYELFKQNFDRDPTFKQQALNVVKSFNGQGVVLKTKEKNQPTKLTKPPSSNNSAAVRAADKVLKQPG